MFDAREKLRSKTMKKPKKKELESPVKPPVSSFDSDEEEYKRKRSIMAGPKKTLTQKDMDEIDLSKADNNKGISESII